MFTIKAFSFNKSTPDEQNEYIKVSSLIGDGSVLDRRKDRNERRITADRRKMLAKFFSKIDKRVLKKRRDLSIRRDSDQELTEAVENIDELELNANTIKGLIREQMDVIERIGDLSTSAKEMEPQEIKDHLQELSCDIRFQNKKEQHFLRLYVGKEVINVNEDVGKSLSELHSDSYTSNSRVLKLMDKYQTADISTKNIGFFLLDLSMIHEKLRENLNMKQSHLYPKYLA